MSKKTNENSKDKKKSTKQKPMFEIIDFPNNNNANNPPNMNPYDAHKNKIESLDKYITYKKNKLKPSNNLEILDNNFDLSYNKKDDFIEKTNSKNLDIINIEDYENKNIPKIFDENSIINSNNIKQYMIKDNNTERDIDKGNEKIENEFLKIMDTKNFRENTENIKIFYDDIKIESTIYENGM